MIIELRAFTDRWIGPWHLFRIRFISGAKRYWVLIIGWLLRKIVACRRSENFLLLQRVVVRWRVYVIVVVIAGDFLGMDTWQLVCVDRRRITRSFRITVVLVTSRTIELFLRASFFGSQDARIQRAIVVFNASNQPGPTFANRWVDFIFTILWPGSAKFLVNRKVERCSTVGEHYWQFWIFFSMSSNPIFVSPLTHRQWHQVDLACLPN